MHSEPDAVAAGLQSESVEQETSPMLHEGRFTRLLSVAVIAERQSFSPGQGALEEEILDEDEAEPVALHAGYDEEFEDLEEETLEGAADLGTMLREMSIDQITAPAATWKRSREEFEEAEYGDAVAADSENSRRELCRGR